ncbi:MAG: hypothetical protein SGCHY_003039 [Lobulomycetales sp.]
MFLSSSRSSDSAYFSGAQPAKGLDAYFSSAQQKARGGAFQQRPVLSARERVARDTVAKAIVRIPFMLQILYAVDSIIGWGVNGVVVGAECFLTGRRVAIKMIYKSPQQRAQGIWSAAVPSEIELLRRFSHANIVSYLDCFEDECNHYLVTEYLGDSAASAYSEFLHVPATNVVLGIKESSADLGCRAPVPSIGRPGNISKDRPGYISKDRAGNMIDSDAFIDRYGNHIDSDAFIDRYGNQIDSDAFIDRYGNQIHTNTFGSGTLASDTCNYSGASEDGARQTMSQIMAGLATMHASGITHGDLKLANCIETRVAGTQGVVKICDFGFASSGPYRAFYGTQAYAPPELLVPVVQGRPSGREADVWAAGLILLQLLGGELRHDIFQAQVHGLWPESGPHSYPGTCSFGGLAGHLLRGMLDVDPVSRLTADEVLDHPWFHAARLS